MVSFENPSDAHEVERMIRARAAGAVDPLASERTLLLRLARRNGFDADPNGIALELIRLYASATPNAAVNSPDANSTKDADGGNQTAS